MYNFFKIFQFFHFFLKKKKSEAMILDTINWFLKIKAQYNKIN